MKKPEIQALDPSIKRILREQFLPLARRKITEKVRTETSNQIQRFGLVGGKAQRKMVPLIGLEPTTHALRMRCSTN